MHFKRKVQLNNSYGTEQLDEEQGISLLKGSKTEAQNLGINAEAKHIF